MLEALEGHARGSIFSCGYGRGYSVREVVAALERATGRPSSVAASPARSGDLAQVIADGRALCAALGWRPDYADLDRIIAHSLAWEQSRPTTQQEGL